MKKLYKVPVVWEMFSVIEVEAENLEDACRIAEEDDTIELPDDGDYVTASW